MPIRTSVLTSGQQTHKITFFAHSQLPPYNTFSLFICRNSQPVCAIGTILFVETSPCAVFISTCADSTFTSVFLAACLFKAGSLLCFYLYLFAFPVHVLCLLACLFKEKVAGCACTCKAVLAAPPSLAAYSKRAARHPAN